MPSPKLLYTPKPEECRNDCDYEKTVWFLCQAGLVGNTSCIMAAFWRDAIGEHSAVCLHHAYGASNLKYSEFLSQIHTIISTYKKVQDTTTSVTSQLILKFYQALAAVAGQCPEVLSVIFLFKYEIFCLNTNFCLHFIGNPSECTQHSSVKISCLVSCRVIYMQNYIYF